MQFEYGRSVIQSSRRRWLVTLMAFLLVTGLILIAPPADAEVSPDEVNETLNPGQWVDVTKTVDVPDVPPMLDVCLLVDLSGSYWDDLVNIKALAPGLWDELDAASDLKMGLASFVDYPTLPWGSGSDYPYRLDQQLTDDEVIFLGAVDGMSTLFGGDLPESQYEALYEIALPSDRDGDELAGCDWRPDAARFVVITTDAEFHNPGDDLSTNPPDGWPGASRDDAVAALTGAGVKVIALKAPGSTTQMDDIATATGGTTEVATSSDSSNIAAAVINALGDISYDITALPVDCGPLDISFNPTSHESVVGGEEPVSFTERILVPLGTTPGTYSCTVDFLADGSPIGTQDVIITVPPQEEEPDVSCQTGETCGFEGETYTGTIVCEDCDVFINEPGPGRFVDLTIEPDKSDGADPSFVVTLIREDRPRTWLRTARLFVFNEAGKEEPVGRCSLRESLRWFARGQEPIRNCSIIVPLRHDRLKYILFWHDDPRMSGA